MMIAITIGVTLLIFINLMVCFGVFRSHSYSHSQKVAQTVLVFIVPIAGAIIVWLFLRENASLPPLNDNLDTDDLKTVGMDAPGSYGSPD